MKKIVLFDANIGNAGAPLALLAITRLLDKSEWDVRIVTKRQFPDYESAVLKECQDACCFGVSCILGPWLKTGLDISCKVKDAFPGIPIVWGGWAATTLPDLAMREPCIDFLCRGQGERTFFDLVTALTAGPGADFKTINGLSYRLDGQVVHNPDRTNEDLNTFPDFDLDLVDWTKHFEATAFGERSLAIYTSVGCPWRCGFCCEQYSCQRKWSAFTPERVVSFISKLKKKADFDSLTLCDDNFFVNEKRVAEICRLLIEAKLNIAYGNVDGRSNELIRYKEPTWKLLRQSGLRSILNGTESANNETLKLITKDTTVEQTLEMVRLCEQNDIRPILSCVMGWDAKRYTEAGADAAFQQEFTELFELFRNVFTTTTRQFKMWIFCYIPLPATPLFETAVKYGFKAPDSLRGWADYDLMAYRPPWMVGISQKNLRKLEVFRYLAQLLGTDYRGYARHLPWALRQIANALIGTAEGVAAWRIRHRFLRAPLDMYVINGAERAFRAMNRVRRMVNLHD